MYYLPELAIILAVAGALFLMSCWTARPERSVLENIVFGMGAILGTLSVLIALRGHITGFNSQLWPLLFFLLHPLDIPLREKPQNFINQLRAVWNGLRSLGRINGVLVLYLLAVCALTLLLTLAPPNGNDYDSLVYHLAAPARYLRDGYISQLAYDHHSYFPLGAEMWFALGLHWRGAVMAKLFNWLLLPLCLLAITAIGRRHFSLRAGLFGATLFASIPIVLIESTTAYVDLALSLWVLLAFGCLLGAQREMNSGRSAKEITRWFLLCGFFCGMAISSKYTGVLYWGALLLWAFGSLLKDRREYSALWPRLAVALLLVPWAIGGLWYLRNWAWTGNPVFPFAYEIFGGKGWTLEMAKAYSHDQAGFGFGKGVLDFLLLPWRVSMAPLNFMQPFWPLSFSNVLTAGSVGRFETAGHVLQAILGPALLAFGAPLIFMRKKPAAAGVPLWTFAAFAVFWAVTSQQIRYLIPTCALLCVPCGWALTEYSRRHLLLRITTFCALGAWLIFVPALTAWRLRDALDVATGAVNPTEYLTRTFDGYEAMQWASENTAKNAVFAVYGEPRCFYLGRNYFLADDPHNNLIDYSAILTGTQLVNALRSLDATNVLVNTRAAQNGGFGAAPPQFEEAENEGMVRLIFEAKGYRVYELASVN